MKRAEVTEKILTAKRIKELTWEEIAKKIGGASKIIVTAACMGQMKMTKEQATKAGKLFGLGKEEVLLLQEVPYRGSLPQVPPTDPLIYRFYELVQVYGTTWKELIQEEFGDGIMSAIDFDMTMEPSPTRRATGSRSACQASSSATRRTESERVLRDCLCPQKVTGRGLVRSPGRALLAYTVIHETCCSDRDDPGGFCHRCGCVIRGVVRLAHFSVEFGIAPCGARIRRAGSGQNQHRRPS